MIDVLQSWSDLSACRVELKKRGLDFTNPKYTKIWRLIFDLRFRYNLLFPIPDTIKSWDVVKVIELLENTHPKKESSILDMGCFNSEILYVLKRLGFKSLYGCDLNPICRWMPFWNSIHYSVCDLTKTPFADHMFSVITCLSVVEHGVPIRALAEEVRRLLSPGGLFILTTDYDSSGMVHNISPEFRTFGQPWRIFDQAGLQELVSAFSNQGFSLLNPSLVRETHQDVPISWNGEKYTFAFVALRAPT